MTKVPPKEKNATSLVRKQSPAQSANAAVKINEINNEMVNPKNTSNILNLLSSPGRYIRPLLPLCSSHLERKDKST